MTDQKICECECHYFPRLFQHNQECCKGNQNGELSGMVSPRFGKPAHVDNIDMYSFKSSTLRKD